jgi:hypothetical protein
VNPIISVIMQVLPSVIDQIQQRHAAANPGAPVLTSEQVLAAFEEAFTSTVLKDDLIIAAHAHDIS